MSSAKLCVCLLCPKTYTTPARLRNHERNIHNISAQTKEGRIKAIEEAMEKAALEKELLAVEKPFVCGDCDKAFSLKRVLYRHATVHPGKEVMVCSGCPTIFKDPEKFSEHQLTCSKSGWPMFSASSKSVVCDQCGKSLKSEYSLLIHKSTNCIGRTSQVPNGVGVSVTHPPLAKLDRHVLHQHQMHQHRGPLPGNSTSIASGGSNVVSSNLAADQEIRYQQFSRNVVSSSMVELPRNVIKSEYPARSSSSLPNSGLDYRIQSQRLRRPQNDLIAMSENWQSNNPPSNNRAKAHPYPYCDVVGKPLKQSNDLSRQPVEDVDLPVTADIPSTRQRHYQYRSNNTDMFNFQMMSNNSASVSVVRHLQQANKDRSYDSCGTDQASRDGQIKEESSLTVSKDTPCSISSSLTSLHLSDLPNRSNSGLSDAGHPARDHNIVKECILHPDYHSGADGRKTPLLRTNNLESNASIQDLEESADSTMSYSSCISTDTAEIAKDDDLEELYEGWTDICLMQSLCFQTTTV